MADAEIIFEFRRLGNSVKVTAIDPATLVEVSLIGPAAWDDATLRRAALRKLAFVRDRRRNGGDKPV